MAAGGSAARRGTGDRCRARLAHRDVSRSPARHRGDRKDAWARLGDVLLGLAWIAFVWSALSLLLRLGLWAAGVDDPLRSRITAAATVTVIVGLALWGHYEAMRTPRVRHTSVSIARLGARFDGLRVVLVTDTHFGPVNRTVWSRRLTDAVNALEPDVLAHVGDIADGSVSTRRQQAAPLESMRASAARVYVTGNHEYFGEAQEWLDHMQSIGWNALHNRHVVLHRGDDALVIAGVDDATAAGSGAPATVPIWLGHWPGPIRRSRCCCWPTSRNRSATPSERASIYRCPATPTAVRSGRSRHWFDWTSRWCTD